MKKIVIIFILLASIAGMSLAQTKPAAVTSIDVYYFHGTRRCPTCISIEENTKKTLDTYYKDLMKSGKVKFTVVDIDNEANEALVNKYEVSGSSLFVVRMTAGKQYPEDMTNFAFSYSRNEPDKFIKGLKDKIDGLLKK